MILKGVKMREQSQIFNEIWKTHHYVDLTRKVQVQHSYKSPVQKSLAAETISLI